MKFLHVQFFDSSEFDSPDLPGSGVEMNLAFVQKLDQLRVDCGFPLVVESGKRTEKHNKDVGGEKDSAHLEGLAVDIRANSSFVRLKIVSCALKLGFTRIGIGSTFVHLDMSTKLDQNVMWVYPSKEKTA